MFGAGTRFLHSALFLGIRQARDMRCLWDTMFQFSPSLFNRRAWEAPRLGFQTGSRAAEPGRV